MKTVHIVSGILLFLLVAVSSASAIATSFLLDQTTTDYTYGVEIKVRVDYNPADNTMEFLVVSPINKVYGSGSSSYTISNVDLKNIWIKTDRENVKVISPAGIWTPNADHGSIGSFGTFTTQISKPDSAIYQSPGPVKIQLLNGVTLDNLIEESGDNYVVAAHVGFEKTSIGANGVPVVIGCSGKVRGDTEIPEFPTMVLPVAAILGLLFITQRRKEN